MNVELRMWNFELVARRAMKNYSIKNYLASYSMFLLVSPSLLGRDGRGFFIASSHPSLTAETFLEINLGALHRKPLTKYDIEIACLFSIRFFFKIKLTI